MDDEKSDGEVLSPNLVTVQRRVEVLPDLGNYPIRHDGPGVDPGDRAVAIVALDEDG